MIRIKRLVCSYNSKDPIIDLSDIEFSSGHVHFIVGKSGIGKSTLIEALGLMSDTMMESSDVLMETSGIGKKYHLDSMWKGSDISEFRRKHYAFIFQNNNLMENFTAGENMSFGLLLNGDRIKNARKTIKPIMLQLSMDDELFDRKVHHLSGGQRQRISFIRAITAPFDVLFCDEPTGNLDPQTSRSLMNIVRTEIKEKDKTALVVSHNIDQALEFADFIYIITRESGHEASCISRDNIMERHEGSWCIANCAISDPKNYLLDRII